MIISILITKMISINTNPSYEYDLEWLIQILYFSLSLRNLHQKVQPNSEFAFFPFSVFPIITAISCHRFMFWNLLLFSISIHLVHLSIKLPHVYFWFSFHHIVECTIVAVFFFGKVWDYPFPITPLFHWQCCFLILL